ncbi:MAG TPA: LptF/LptG family permease [Abditibacterium sp.]
MPATSNLRAAPEIVSEKASRPKRRGPIPIADAYLLRQVVESSLRGLGWFAGLFLAFAVVTSARRVAQDDLPLTFVIEMIALQAPRIILFTIPASLLFGTVSTFTEMSSKGEITALMAGGMSLWKMLRGPLVFAALMGVFALWLQEIVVPGTESRKDDAVKSAAMRLGVQQDFKIVTPPKGAVKSVVQAESFDPSKKLLTKPVIQIFRPDHSVETEIRAETARWDAARKAWIFQNGWMLTNRDPATLKADETFSVPVQFPELALQTEMPALSQMGSGARTTQDRLANKNYEMVSWHDLSIYRAQLQAQYAQETGADKKKTGKEIRAMTFGMHDKFATPLVCIAMVLLGAPLGIRPQRTASSGLAMGLSLLVLISYYIVWTMATSWGKAGLAAPQYVAYLSFVITAGTGVVMVTRKS